MALTNMIRTANQNWKPIVGKFVFQKGIHDQLTDVIVSYA